MNLSYALMVPLVLIFVGCGDGSSGGDDAPPLPRANDPAFGSAGHALISDRALLGGPDGTVDQVWIGFSSADEWRALVSLSGQDMVGTFWVCGTVVLDANHLNGFYFDPATTSAAEVTAETQQTALDAIPMSSECLSLCCIAAGVERTVPEP